MAVPKLATVVRATSRTPRLTEMLVPMSLTLAARAAYSSSSTAGRPTETAIPFDPNTKLGPRAVDAQAAHPGKSGVLP